MSTKVLGGIGILGAGAGAYYMFGKEKTIPKIIISGGPASGKGTQCELIVDKCEAARSARARARVSRSLSRRDRRREPPPSNPLSSSGTAASTSRRATRCATT